MRITVEVRSFLKLQHFVYIIPAMNELKEGAIHKFAQIIISNSKMSLEIIYLYYNHVYGYRTL